MVMACERDAFLLSRGQMVDASRPLVLFHRLPLSPVSHDEEERRGETPAKGGIYNLHQSLWWLVHHWATFRWVFAIPVSLTRPRIRSSTLHNINLSFRWVDASRPFQAILCAILVINYSARYFCNVVLSRRAGISRGDRGECWIIAHGLSDFSTGFHFSKQTAFTFLVDGEVSFRWISARRWIFREIFRDFGVLGVAKCRCIKEI